MKLLIAFLLLHILVSGIYIHYQEITIDEGPYYNYTVRWAHGSMKRLYAGDDSKTPATFPAIIPRTVYQFFHPGYLAKDDGLHDMKMGRYCMCLYTIIIACYLFVWCRKLFGKNEWIFPVLFFLFNPLVLGYSMIILSDMATGACMVATLFHLSTFYHKRKLLQFICFSVWLGLGIVAKASFIFMMPCLVLLLIILVASRKVSFNIKKIALYSGLAFLIVLVMVNVGYFGVDSFKPLSIYQFESRQFQQLAEKFSAVKSWYVPVPAGLIQGLDMLQHHKEIGPGSPLSTYCGVDVLGKNHLDGPVWYYYLVTGAVKFPIAVLLLLVAALITGIKYFNSKRFFGEHIFYAFPLFFYLVFLSCFNTFQGGIRHLLIIYPLMIMGIGAAVTFWKAKWKKTTLITAALFATMIASELYYFPNLIPYTNEFILDKKFAYKIVLDTNVGYGQYERYQNIFLEENPGYRKAPLKPETGKFIIAIEDILKERFENLNAYQWLLKLEPKAHYKFSFLLYEVRERDMLQTP